MADRRGGGEKKEGGRSAGLAPSASIEPTGQLPERSQHARGRVRGDGTEPASNSQIGDEIGGTDTDGNNNSQNVESNYKIYNHVVT